MDKEGVMHLVKLMDNRCVHKQFQQYPCKTNECQTS